MPQKALIFNGYKQKGLQNPTLGFILNLVEN